MRARRADDCAARHLWRAPVVYFRSKVKIAGDRAAIVSSANLNGRSLRRDTEAGIWLERPDQVGALRARCFEHWLDGEDATDPFVAGTAQRASRALAACNAQTPPKPARLRHAL